MKNQGFILNYNGITDCDNHVSSHTVSFEIFEKQIDYISKNIPAIPFKEMVAGIKRKSLPKNGIAVAIHTMNGVNLLKIKQVLEKFKVPAIFYILPPSFGCIDGKIGDEQNWNLKEREVRELQNGGLFEIGINYNCAISYQSEWFQKDKLDNMLNIFKKKIGIKEVSLSYQGSTRGGKRAINIKKAGYYSAITNIEGNITELQNTYFLPTRLMGNWDIDEFINKLSYFRFDNKQMPEKIKVFEIAKAFYNKCLNKYTNTIGIDPKIDSSVHSVCMVNGIDTVGGAAKVAYRLHYWLRKRGYRTSIEVGDKISTDKDVHSLANRNNKEQLFLNKFEHVTGINNLFYLNSFDLFSELKTDNPDIFHFHNLHDGYFNKFAIAYLSLARPVIWTLHDMQSVSGHCAYPVDCMKWMKGCIQCGKLSLNPAIKVDASNINYQINKIIYSNSILTIVCPSEWIKKEILKSNLQDHKIRVIYNGIDTEVFKFKNKLKAKKELGLPADKTILLFSANLGLKNPWKGGKYLLKTYKELKKRKDILFIFVGSKQHKVSSNRIDIPYISSEKEMAKYYAAADLFIYPSLFDNCPLVVFESMACGTPVVAFETGGIPEQIIHCKTGYLARYKDFDDFLSGILWFVNDKTNLTRESVESRKRVEKYFSMDKMAEQYIELYNESFNEFIKIRKGKTGLIQSNKDLLINLFNNHVEKHCSITILKRLDLLYTFAIKQKLKKIPIIRRIKTTFFG